MCNCKLASYNGACECNSSFAEISSTDLETLNSNFEDTLFRESYYASDNEFADFLGKRKKAITTDAVKPKKDLKKTLSDGADIFSKVAGIFSGKSASAGGVESAAYEARLGQEGDLPKDTKKILGMPVLVFYSVAAAASILVIILILKISKK
ncbi:MAG TPA: hypothetical protein VF691_04185 [Cytophagaceae bacterium]|jgi:hypothetical protein